MTRGSSTRYEPFACRVCGATYKTLNWPTPWSYAVAQCLCVGCGFERCLICSSYRFDHVMDKCLFDTTLFK